MSLPGVELQRPGRVLDFDIENRPLSYTGMEYTSAEITAIAWSWEGSNKVFVATLAPPPAHEGSALAMLSRFKSAYDEADMVTGHYIRRHDLPIVNAHLLEYKFPLLGPKLTSDTRLDLTKKKDFSASQKSLCAAFGLPEQKHDMSQQDWRDANRLTPSGIAATVKRVRDDVIQHKALRQELLERGALGPPRVWRP